MKNYLSIGLLLFTIAANAQVGVGTTAPKSTLDIPASNAAAPTNQDGILLPRISAFPGTIPTVDQNGMMVFLTIDLPSKPKGFYYWDEPTTSWVGIGGAKGWDLTGNAGTNATTNFIGTTDSAPLNFKINSQKAGLVDLSGNSFFGLLSGNGSGINNTASGYNSLKANTTGSENTAIGFNAMLTNLSGFANTGIGSNALYNTKGSNNVGIGYFAGSNISSGSNNIAIGLNAAVATPTGSAQLAIGNSIFGTNIDDQYNTKIGIGIQVPSAKFQVGSPFNPSSPTNTDGIIIPRVSALVAAAAMTAAQNGMMVFLTTLFSGNAPGFYYWDNPNNIWKGIGSGTAGWGLTGNSGTNQTTNFIGTTDGQDLVFKRNGMLAGTIGLQQTSFGQFALSSLTTGTFNTAFGSSSLSANAGGRWNAAFGMGALAANINADLNSAFGFNALNKNTTGRANTGVGEQAMQENISGSRNTSLGFQTLMNNTIGTDNVALGNTSLLNNTTASKNVAIGVDALMTQSFNNGGAAFDANNVAVGDGAMYNNNPTSATTGKDNTALGSKALDTNVTGIENTAIGSQADVTTANLTNATAIGAKATVGSSNSLILGSINGVNGATNSASVGIGKNTPEAALDITSANKGLLIPRVALTASTQSLPVTNPQGGSLANSTMIYNTATAGDVTPGFYYWDVSRWVRINADFEGRSKYFTVMGTTSIVAPTAFAAMPEMTNTFTPNSSVVFAHFSVAGTNLANACGQNPVRFRLMVNGISVQRFQTSMEDFTGTYSGQVSWDMNFIYPVTVTPGIPQTVSIEWLAPCGGVVSNAPATDPFSHRVLTIVDPNGGGGVVGSPPVTSNLWSLDGNSGTDPAVDFIGTVDAKDLVFKRNGIQAGKLGASNVGLGVNAGQNVTIGGSNTAIGTLAMQTNVAGTGGTAVGAMAMAYVNSTPTGYPNKNTAIGYQSIRGFATPASNTGNENTAIGHQTLSSVSTGSYNTVGGVNALTANTIGNYNTAFGHNSLLKMIGSENTAIGVNTLQNATSGNFNTSLGTNSLYSATATSNNTALGHSALYANGTGTGNVAIGYQAGYNETGSNKLYIENTGATTPLVYGEFDNDLLRINGKLLVRATGSSSEMQVKNSNVYVHGGGNKNFSPFVAGGEFMLSSQEGLGDSAGIRGDGDDVTIWSASDNGRIVRFVDEDSWTAATSPYGAAEMAYVQTNGAYFQVSDRNKKEHIEKIENAIDKVKNLNGYTYQFKQSDEEIAKGEAPIKSSGVIAQELEKVLPEGVEKTKEGNYFVNYASITPLLIEAVKAQQSEISELKKQFESQQKINDELMDRLKKLESAK